MRTYCVGVRMSGIPILQRFIEAGMARTALKGLNIVAQGKRSVALGELI